MTRHITAHKGGRTARAPQARIRPQTLDAIRATMQERDKSFADLLEEQYGQGDDTMAYMIDYKVGLDDAPNHGWVAASRDFRDIRKSYNTRSDAERAASDLEKSKNVKTRIRESK